jgi:hypothetical protein
MIHKCRTIVVAWKFVQIDRSEINYFGGVKRENHFP